MLDTLYNYSGLISKYFMLIGHYVVVFVGLNVGLDAFGYKLFNLSRPIKIIVGLCGLLGLFSFLMTTMLIITLSFNKELMQAESQVSVVTLVRVYGSAFLLWISWGLVLFASIKTGFEAFGYTLIAYSRSMKMLIGLASLIIFLLTTYNAFFVVQNLPLINMSSIN